jgi:hypothetical protein
MNLHIGVLLEERDDDLPRTRPLDSCRSDVTRKSER